MARSEKKRNSILTSFRAGLLIIVATITLEATSLIQFYFSQSALMKEANLRAQSQLENTRLNIMDVVDQTEAAVRNSVWIATWCLDVQDSLKRVCQRVVEDNPVVAGSAVALVPTRTQKQLCPYVYRDGDSLILRTLATEAYDYPSQEWFVKPIETEEGYWSEPYMDEGGGEMLMTTYSVPLRNAKGEIAAVLTADISLEWLNSIAGGFTIFSRSGNKMVGPDVAPAGDDSFVYSADVERTGWSMSIVIPKEELFASFRKLAMVVKILQILGILLLVFILRSLIRSQNKYRALNEVKDRLEDELRIASGIQMSMIPKTFPPFPERKDLDLSALIVPAKEVGGDLYDFFIRDEKLFFCVGDVSGKGVPASLIMAVTRSMFRAVSAHEDSPGSIVSKMNDSMADMNETDMFVTIFLGVLDLRNGLLRYCNAGHNAPMTLTDSIEDLPVIPNLPLGVMPGFDYMEQELQMKYDDAIFIYTDGLTEAENITHEQFGLERAKAALHTRRNASDHLDNIRSAVAAFVGDAPQSDDLTMLFIHYLNPTSL